MAAAPRTFRAGWITETKPMRQPAGATVAQIAEATGWAQHTVAVKPRDRMVGPNKTGATGSLTVDALAD